jgi:hypothetical protein
MDRRNRLENKTIKRFDDLEADDDELVLPKNEKYSGREKTKKAVSIAR